MLLNFQKKTKLKKITIILKQRKLKTNKNMSSIQLKALNFPESLDDLQRAIIDYSTPKNILLFSLGLSTSYLLYKLVKFYLYKRKYRHIPGPPTNGYF